MNKELKSVSIKKKKNKKEVRVTVEEIENGYLLIENIEYEDPKKGWQYETRKTYYEEPPIKEPINNLLFN